MDEAIPDSQDFKKKVERLRGPILVLGASGFVGANLFKSLLCHREDVFGTTRTSPAWRLTDVPQRNVRKVDLLVESNLHGLLQEARPRTVFDCIAYGGYPFETNSLLIYQTNFIIAQRLLSLLQEYEIASYVHAGSSSEYGDNAAGPTEEAALHPNSDYAVSKVATANLLYYWGKRKKLPAANLRLYSVYGPLEDSSRLVPNIIRYGTEGRYPDLVDPTISRDFVFIEDVIEVFVDTSLNLAPADYGESFNIGTGKKTTIAEVAELAATIFGIQEKPTFSMPARNWDVAEWFANTAKTHERLGWQPRYSLRDGLVATVKWYRQLADRNGYHKSSKSFGTNRVFSISAIIACYKDEQAIPIMYDRIKGVCEKLALDFEIIFVNDASPDDTENVIRAITRDDYRVIGISHSRNFGSQAAFISGMRIATKNACVLLDGDLQDPPELIEQFVAKWREGYEVVYGRRVKRDATLFMQVAYKLFYRVFDFFSEVPIPHDAGDFSLMDRRVLESLLQFPERDLFLRGVRAFAGFKQTGVDYVRPRRMFGVSTNSLLKNIGWAKKGILAFTSVPLSVLSFAGVVLFILTFVLIVTQVLGRLLFPALVAPGVTTVLVAILFFGSTTLLAVGVIGEYVAKILQEVKRRPLFIRSSIIQDGQSRPAWGDEAARQTKNHA